MSEPSKPQQPQLTPEQLKQLMMLQQMMQQKDLPKKEVVKRKILSSITTGMQNLVVKLDRLVNFIVKKTDADRNEVSQAARAPILFGIYVIVFVIGIGFSWAALAPLDSAAHAMAFLVSSTNKKVIQAPLIEGGTTIKDIYVKQGDQVKEGQVLVKFDDTRVKVDYEAVLNQYRTFLATENRLVAERDNLDSIDFDEFLTKDLNIPSVGSIISTQENIFRSEKELMRTQIESFKQKIAQTRKAIEQQEFKKDLLKKNLKIISERVQSAMALHKKGFASKAYLLDLESKEMEVRTQIDVTESEITKEQREVTNLEISIVTKQNEFFDRILERLRENQLQLSQAKEKFLTFTDFLKKVELKSPVDGIVNNVQARSLATGGLIQAGQTIMEISPLNDTLVLEARVPPQEIHAIHVGLRAKINFSAFKSRTTPSFIGTVVSISPDVVVDQGPNGQSSMYYAARIELNMDEFNKVAKAKNLVLHPGMQADVNIVRGERTLLRYLLDPLIDTMFKAFKER